MAGIVRAHVAAKEHGLPLLVGSQFLVRCDAPFTLVVLACSLEGYGNLCEFITKLRRAAPKGTYELTLDNIDPDELRECVVIASPERSSTSAQIETIARWLLANFTGRCWLGVELLRTLDDEMWLHRLREASELTAIHSGGQRRRAHARALAQAAAGRHDRDAGGQAADRVRLRAAGQLRASPAHAAAPGADLSRTTSSRRRLRVAERCDFSLDELSYQYPDEVVPAGETPTSYLRRLTYEGAGRRWPHGHAGQGASRRSSTSSS